MKIKVNDKKVSQEKRNDSLRRKKIGIFNLEEAVDYIENLEKRILALELRNK